LKANVISLGIIFVGLIIFASNAASLPWTPWRIAGIAIALPAFVLLVISRIELGRAFSLSAKASILVTSGIYSRIRNPVYVFGSLLFLGLIIWTGRPLLLLLLVALIPLQVYRSRKEQAVLMDKFGDEYLAYKQQTWF
jgi:protein-S-isoprenylcysteine O-methyltransferase Ste14